MLVSAPAENKELVTLLKQKTRESFSMLYDRYSPVLFGVICRTINDKTAAEDILQEVFIKVWKNIDQYDEQKAGLFTWLLSITRYTTIDYLRSKGFKQKAAIQTSTHNEYIEDKSVVQAEDDINLRSFVIKLEPKYREIIDLVYFLGYTQNEVAQMLNLPLGTVKTRARTGLQILRKQLS